MRDYYNVSLEFLESGKLELEVEKVCFIDDVDASVTLLKESYNVKNKEELLKTMNEDEKFIGVKTLYYNRHYTIDEVNTILEKLAVKYDFEYKRIEDKIQKEDIVKVILEYLEKEPDVVEYVPKNALWPSEFNYYILRYKGNRVNFMLMSYDDPEVIRECRNNPEKREFCDYLIRISITVLGKNAYVVVSPPDKYNIFEKMMNYWDRKKIIKA